MLYRQYIFKAKIKPSEKRETTAECTNLQFHLYFDIMKSGIPVSPTLYVVQSNASSCNK